MQLISISNLTLYNNYRKIRTLYSVDAFLGLNVHFVRIDDSQNVVPDSLQRLKMSFWSQEPSTYLQVILDFY